MSRAKGWRCDHTRIRIAVSLTLLRDRIVGTTSVIEMLNQFYRTDVLIGQICPLRLALLRDLRGSRPSTPASEPPPADYTTRRVILLRSSCDQGVLTHCLKYRC